MVVAGYPRTPVAEGEGDQELRAVRPGPVERDRDFRTAEKHCARPPQKRQ